MITKNDCMTMLVNLEDRGVSIDAYMKKLLISKTVPLEVLQFIAANQGLEATNFYEMLRISHNKKKSPLYTNILRDITDESEILTTLSSLITQILLYSRKTANKEQFIKEVRAEEISRVLNIYFKDGDIRGCKAILDLIKSDLLVLEYINGRRELASNQ